MAETEHKVNVAAGAPAPGGPFEELERWLNEYLPRAWIRRWGSPSWGELTRPIERLAPRIDIIERDEEVVLFAELPGVAKDDLELIVYEQTVTIKGNTRRRTADSEGEYFRAEIAAGDFSRSVSLPGRVEAEKSQAKFTDGLLELRIPKRYKTRHQRVKID
jgi:HSP20 family protein